jgi:multidrug efflux pump subunit AcrB
MSAPVVDANPANGVIRAFLNHKVAPNLVAVLMCIAGLVALTRLNTQFFPSTNIPVVTVSVIWPGASADDIQSGILDVLEPEVRFVDGVDTVSSYATDGSVRITLEFKDGTDMNKALADVETRVRNVTTLPADAERPVVTRLLFYETVAMVAISGPHAEGALQDVSKRLRDRLLNQGIDRVVFQGKRDQEIWVEIPPDALRQLDMTSRDVADRIGLLSQNQPLGMLEGGAERTMRARGRVTTADGVAAIELRALDNGQRVLVRDVAVVREAFSEGAIRVAQANRTAILLDIQRAERADTLRSMETTRRVVAEIQASLPPTVSVQLFDVRAEIVNQRIIMLANNAWQGMLIVVIVLLVFLNARVAMWVAAGVPIALLATFGFMLATGQSINAISLVALIMVLGIIVDDAIVVGEQTAKYHEDGMSAHDAAEKAATRMFLPVLASTSTTQAAFFPMFLITGVIGQILAAIPMVIIVALAASLLECFLTLPAHLKHALEKGKRSAGGRLSRWGAAYRRAFDRGFGAVRDRGVRPAVALAYRWRYVTMAAAISSVILSIGLVAGGRVGFTFFPVPEPDNIHVDITFAPGVPEARMLEATARIEETMRAVDRELTGERPGLVTAIYTVLGQRGVIRGSNVARVEVELTPGEIRTVRTNRVMAALTARLPAIPGVDSAIVAERRGGPPGADVDVRLTGRPIEVLKQASMDIQRRLGAVPGLVGLTDDLPWGRGEVLLEVNPRGRALGLTTESVARQVRGAFQGAIAVRFTRGDEEVTVRVRQTERDRGLAGLLGTTLRTPAGQEVELAEVVAVRETAAFSVVQRRDGRTAVSVTANAVPGITSTQAVLAILERDIMPEVVRAHGVEYSYQGRAETQRRAFRDLGLGAMVALALIYLILAFVFASWSQPILVMAIIPFGITGAILGHWAMGFDLALLSLVGLLGLSGILVNGSIVLLDRMNERIEEGEDVEDAAIGASADRLRALVLTTLTTVGGMAPLLMETSFQAQFLIPVAISLSFGLAFATILVLFVMPALVGIAADVGLALRATRAFLFGRPALHPAE